MINNARTKVEEAENIIRKYLRFVIFFNSYFKIIKTSLC